MDKKKKEKNTGFLYGILSALTLFGSIYFAFPLYEVVLAGCLILIAYALFSLMVSPEKKKRAGWLIFISFACFILWLVCVDEVEVPGDVKKITVSYNGGPLTTFSYTDEEKLYNVEAYLTSLDPRFALIHPGNTGFAGGSWVMQADTGTETMEVILSGSFIKMPDGKWRKLSITKLDQFKEVLKENVPDEMPENDEFYKDFAFDEWY